MPMNEKERRRAQRPGNGTGVNRKGVGIRVCFVCFLMAAGSLAWAQADTGLRFSLEETQPAKVFDHFPLEVGNRWIYRETYTTEIGAPPRKIKSTWGKEVNIVEHFSIPEGTLVRRREQFSDFQHDFSGEWTAEQKAEYLRRLPTGNESYSLIRGNYIFDLGERGWDPERGELTGRFRTSLDTTVVPDFFFPMTLGLMWAEKDRERRDLAQATRFRQGTGGAPNPGMYYWRVEGREDVAVPYGTVAGAFRLVYRSLSGPVERWFKDGVGVVRERKRHSGSYLESESVLVEFLKEKDKKAHLVGSDPQWRTRRRAGKLYTYIT